MHRPLKIAFWGFWPDFIPENNLFIKTLNLEYDIKIVNPFFTEQDIMFTSFFERGVHSRMKTIRFTKPAKLKILFSGESYLTGFDKFDATISTLDFPSPSNIYLPFWFHYMDWFGDGDVRSDLYKNFGRAIKPDELLRPLKFQCRKFKFSIVYNNNHYLRPAFVKHLNLTSENALIVGPDQSIDSKLSALSKASANLCFENTVAHGYVTEKLIEAFSAGCYPIYYGAPLSKQIYTPDNILNIFEISSQEDFKEIVANYLSAHELKPLLKIDPRIIFENFKEELFRLIEKFI